MTNNQLTPLARALLRLLRGYAAVAAGAGLAWLALAITQEPDIDPKLALALAPIIMAGAKYLRDKGWITLPL